jgi:hypothetical protein
MRLAIERLENLQTARAFTASLYADGNNGYNTEGREVRGNDSGY